MKSFTILGIMDHDIIYTTNHWYKISKLKNSGQVTGFFTLKLISEGFILTAAKTLDSYTLKSISPFVKEELNKVINYYNEHKRK